MSDPADPITHLQALIRCRSVTPDEGGALSYLEQVLAGIGCKVERPVFSEPSMPDVENLFATIGSGAPHFVFAGHTDVVPAGEEAKWSRPPFAGEIVDDQVYGRGAVDMKGAIAAFLAALADFTSAGQPKGTISLLITGDEEGPAVNGTIKLLKWAAERDQHFDAAIVGEPTNSAVVGDAIKIGRRGSISGTIRVIGRQGHSAYPERAANPLPGLIRLLDAMLSARLDEGTEHFQPSNLEITSIDVGNPAFNVIPGEATARFNIRFNDRWTSAELAEWVRHHIAQNQDPALQYELELQRPTESFLTDAPDFVATLKRAIADVTGQEPQLSTGGGTSDARFIKDYCPVVDFGLVGTTMHQVDERVPVADLKTLAEIYRRFLELYFAPGGTG